MAYGYIILDRPARLRLMRVITLRAYAISAVMIVVSPVWLTLDYIAERRSRKASK